MDLKILDFLLKKLTIKFAGNKKAIIYIMAFYILLNIKITETINIIIDINIPSIPVFKTT